MIDLEIASSDSTYYDRSNSGFEPTPNLTPTPEQIETIMDATGQVPGIDALLQLIIIYRNRKPFPPDGQDIPTGRYLGYLWPEELAPSEEWKPDRETLPSTKAACALYVPYKDTHRMNTPLVTMTSLIMKDPLPIATYGDSLRHTIIHETGHGLEDQIRLAGSATIKEYLKRKEYEDLNTGYYFDVEHPLLKSFARLAGFRLIRALDFHPKSKRDGIKHYNPEYEDEFVYIMDPKVWGRNRFNTSRFMVNPRFHKIEEAFANYWTASIVAPDLLTENEREYFRVLHRGLLTNPREFIQAIANGEVKL